MKIVLIAVLVLLIGFSGQGKSKESTLCPRGSYFIDTWSTRQPFLVAVAPIKSGTAALVPKEGDVYRFECQLLAIPENPPQTIARTSLSRTKAETTIYIEDAEGRKAISYNKEEGAPCWKNNDCATGSFCLTRPGHCTLERGICSKKPIVCTQEYNPVTGCDGKSYGNSCAAAAAGISVKGAGKP